MTVWSVIFFILGCAAGAAVVWFFAASRHHRRTSELESRLASGDAIIGELRERSCSQDQETERLRNELSLETQARVEALTRLEASEQHLKEEMERIEKVRGELSDTFKALSLDALTKNTEEFKKYADEFIKLAEEKMKSQTAENKKELEGKKELIDRNIETIGKSLTEVQRRVEEVGKVSGEKITEVATLIKKHEEVTSKLKETTEHLGHALASSKKRGEWGERMAEDIIRLIGMVEGVNYIKQKTLEHSSGRPDYTFLLPNSLKINMDVKFPLDNYVHYLDAESDHDKKRFRDELLKNTKLMIKQVTSREYINPADNTVDYVLIFIPNEQVYGFINEADPTIMDEALRQKVILCSPFTLYAVLAVIRQSIENFNLERTASEILTLLMDFSKQWTAFKDKFRIMGERLDAAKKEYDALLTTRSNVLERPLRKIDELGKQKAISLTGDIVLGETSSPE
ncbi:MAG TPA: DNA recombination protein RmuC [Syntrophorhabdaceae bacterium]|nr:DNA recombination protein RmuC [Syntrophorhabdaceae bacterium]